MAKRKVVGTVTVKRPHPSKDGANIRVSPKVGEIFDFTADEIKEFDRITPGALLKLDATDTDVETPSHPAESVATASPPAEKPAAKPAAKKTVAPKDDDDL